MIAREVKRETTIGVLLLLGVGIVCGAILFLGAAHDLFRPTYSVTVQFPDASGLVKGSDVDMSGAVIGKVMTDPQPVPGTLKVQVNLKINANVPLRQGARYVIESSGIFGDKFVRVSPPICGPGETKAAFVQDGDVIQGTRDVDMSALTAAAIPLIDVANHAAGELDDMITRLNQDVLTGKTVDDLNATFSQLPKAADEAQTVITNSKDLAAKIKTGQGPIGQYLNDPSMKKDLADFMANYKEHGAVFYSNDTAPARTPAKAQNRPSWRSRP